MDMEIPFPATFSFYEAQKLQVGDCIDVAETEWGQFVPGTIMAIHDDSFTIVTETEEFALNETKWSLFVIGKARLHCLAKHGAFSQRPATKMVNVKIGDMVEGNLNGVWMPFEVTQKAFNNGQVKVSIPSFCFVYVLHAFIFARLIFFFFTKKE